MKKSKINTKNILEDLDDILKLTSELDDFDLEKTNLKLLEQKIKNKEKYIKNKYKDLDTKK